MQSARFAIVLPLIDLLRGNPFLRRFESRLVEFVTTTCYIDYRARYNLACYRARAWQVEVAAQELDAVFAEAPEDLRAWA
jgi:hypothetical protein